MTLHFRVLANRKGLPILIAMLIAASAVFGISSWLQTRPHRLFELRGLRPISVSNGVVLLAGESSDGNCFAIRKKGAEGGPEEEVAQDCTKGAGKRFGVVAGDLALYSEWDLPKRPRRGAITSVLVPARMRYVRLSGGPVRTLPVALRAPFAGPERGFAVLGRTVFWIGTAPRENPTRRAVGSPVGAIAESFALYATSLNGGSTRVVAEGLPEMATVHEGSTRVYWTVPRYVRGFGIRSELHFCSESGADRGKIAEYNATSAPAELSGRLYWFPLVPEEGSRSDGPVLTLASANRDGTGLRFQPLVMAASMANPDRQSLASVGGRLYMASSEVPGVPARLYHIELSDSPRLIVERTLPHGAQQPGYFDGQYYYFVVRETHDQWWNSSAEGLMLHHATALYRCRLDG